VETHNEHTRGTLETREISNNSQSGATVRKDLKVGICGVDQQVSAETLFPGVELPMWHRHGSS